MGAFMGNAHRPVHQSLTHATWTSGPSSPLCLQSGELVCVVQRQFHLQIFVDSIHHQPNAIIDKACGNMVNELKVSGDAAIDLDPLHFLRAAMAVN